MKQQQPHSTCTNPTNIVCNTIPVKFSGSRKCTLNECAPTCPSADTTLLPTGTGTAGCPLPTPSMMPMVSMVFNPLPLQQTSAGSKLSTREEARWQRHNMALQASHALTLGRAMADGALTRQRGPATASTTSPSIIHRHRTGSMATAAPTPRAAGRRCCTQDVGVTCFACSKRNGASFVASCVPPAPCGPLRVRLGGLHSSRRPAKRPRPPQRRGSQ